MFVLLGKAKVPKHKHQIDLKYLHTDTTRRVASASAFILIMIFAFCQGMLYKHMDSATHCEDRPYLCMALRWSSFCLGFACCAFVNHSVAPSDSAEVYLVLGIIRAVIGILAFVFMCQPSGKDPEDLLREELATIILKHESDEMSFEKEK